MPSRKPSRADRLAYAIAHRGYTRIGEEEWRQLLADLAPVTEDALRRVVRQCGLPLSPLVEGVRTSTVAETERTALAVAAEYNSAMAAGDVERARRCRYLVISAKERARLAAMRAGDGERRAEKQEIADCLLVWLETPDLFQAWLDLRNRATAGRSSASATSGPVCSSIE